MSAIADLAEDYVMGRLDPEARAAVEARIAAPEGPDDRDALSLPATAAAASAMVNVVGSLMLAFPNKPRA